MNMPMSKKMPPLGTPELFPPAGGPEIEETGGEDPSVSIALKDLMGLLHKKPGLGSVCPTCGQTMGEPA